MAERSYFVKLNLDDMAASLDALDSTEERGQWLEGFRVGSRGNAPRDGWVEAKAIGHAFGLSCWEKAEEFREKQSAKGKASGMARSNRTESEPESNHGSTTVQPRMNQTPNREGTNQKPETRSQQQEATSEQPMKQEALSRRPSIAEVLEYAQEIDLATPNQFFDHYQSNGWKVGGRSPMKDWKAAMRQWKARDFSKPTNRPLQPPKPKWTGFTAEYYGDGPVVQRL